MITGEPGAMRGEKGEEKGGRRGDKGRGGEGEGMRRKANKAAQSP